MSLVDSPLDLADQVSALHEKNREGLVAPKVLVRQLPKSLKLDQGHPVETRLKGCDIRELHLLLLDLQSSIEKMVKVLTLRNVAKLILFLFSPPQTVPDKIETGRERQQEFLFSLLALTKDASERVALLKQMGTFSFRRSQTKRDRQRRLRVAVADPDEGILQTRSRN